MRNNLSKTKTDDEPKPNKMQAAVHTLTRKVPQPCLGRHILHVHLKHIPSSDYTGQLYELGLTARRQEH